MDPHRRPEVERNLMLSTTETETLATCILIEILAAVVLRGIIRFRRHTRYTWPQAPIYLLNLVYTRVVWRATVEGKLPVEGGAVIVSNHSSGIDPCFTQLATDRIVHWMVAREYTSNPLLAWAFRITESIPVNRGGVDTAGTKMAIRYARQGDLVGLFPEGRINQTDALLLPGRPGAALIALKTRVPVIPCYIRGAPYDGTAYGSFLMTAKTHVVIGKPIDLSAYYDLEERGENHRQAQAEVTKIFLREIAKLAGVEDWPVELAGRRWAPRFDRLQTTS